MPRAKKQQQQTAVQEAIATSPERGEYTPPTVDAEFTEDDGAQTQFIPTGEELKVYDNGPETLIAIARSVEWHDDLLEHIGSFFVARQMHALGNEVAIHKTKQDERGYLEP